MTGPAWRRYLRFWGTDPGADADDELRFHLESRARDLVAEGMTPEAARAEALRRFGDVQQVRRRVAEVDRQLERDRRRVDLWDAVKQDLRYARRTLGRSPGFALVAVLTLALGIGANTAIFSVINGVLLRPLPYREPERLVRIFTAWRGQGAGSGGERSVMSQPEFMDYKGLTRVFENAAAYRGTGLTLTGDGGEPERLQGMAATRDLLPVLGIAPFRGRNFEGGEGRQGTEPVVIVTHELWQDRFGADPALLGRQLVLNGVSRRVIGILPKGTTFEPLLHVHIGQRVQAIVPYHIDPDSLTSRSSNFLSGVARLRAGVTVGQAQRELNALTRRLTEDFPRAYPAAAGFGATAVAMHDEVVGDVKPALFILLGAVALVLLIACANVANLLLARGEARQREIAVRLALGAGARRVVRQLLTESIVLALAGGVAGVVLAWGGVKAILAVNPDAIPRMHEVKIDAAVGAVTLATALVTGLAFGLAPALQLVRGEQQSALKEGGRWGSDGRQRLGRALVSAEVALAVVVVIGATLLVRSFWSLRYSDAGFDAEQALVVDLGLPDTRYDIQATTVFYRRLVERLGALPGVEVAAAASDLPPIAGGNGVDVEIEGRPTPPGQADPAPELRAVTAEYFRALRLSMASGRPLGPGDTQGSLPVGVLNETAARVMFAGLDAVGRRLRYRDGPWITIVGVARDVPSMGLGRPAPAELFVPHEQLPEIRNSTMRVMYVVLRTTGDPLALAAASRQVVRELDPLLAVIDVSRFTDLIHRSVAQPRFTMLLLGAFGAVALVLAAVGIYGILSYAVKRRTREIGIRIALGGAPRHVLWLVVGQGMRLVLAGLVAGLLAALAATRLMAGLLYGVTATDPLTFAGIAALLAAVALLASWLPARRAVRTDPRGALGGG